MSEYFQMFCLRIAIPILHFPASLKGCLGLFWRILKPGICNEKKLQHQKTNCKIKRFRLQKKVVYKKVVYKGIFQNKKMTVWCLHIPRTWSSVIWGETNPEHGGAKNCLHTTQYILVSNNQKREVWNFLWRTQVENYNSWFYVKLSVKQANIYLVLLLDWIT